VADFSATVSGRLCVFVGIAQLTPLRAAFNLCSSTIKR
jgi:hypothetical protein